MGCSCARSALWCILGHHRVLRVACPCQKPGSERGLDSASAPSMPAFMANACHSQKILAFAYDNGYNTANLGRPLPVLAHQMHAQCMAGGHLAEEGGVDGVPQHSVEPVSKLVEVLLVSAVLLQMARLARLNSPPTH